MQEWLKAQTILLYVEIYKCVWTVGPNALKSMQGLAIKNIIDI